MIRMLRTTLRTGDDSGSVLILTLGYAVLAMVAVLICADATNLYLAQKRLDGLADAAALAGAEGYTLTVADGEPVASLSTPAVHAQAESLLAHVGGDAVLVDARTPDGVSARVTVAEDWHPPVLTMFVPAGIPLQATATSRTALR